MKAIQWLACGLLLASASAEAVAQNELAPEERHDASILIDADQLREKLSDTNLRLIDVRSAADYAKGHIPGAVRVDVGQWKDLAVAVDGLRDEKGWTDKLSPLGLNHQMTVAVYGSKLSDTARIWWLLKYVGVKDVAILNGGWEWWTKNEGPSETSSPTVSATPFKPSFQSDRVAEMDSLKLSLKSRSVKIVDTRSDEEFNGGRVPGAAHLEWKELVADDGRFKTKPQLKQLFTERGIVRAETAVCY